MELSMQVKRAVVEKLAGRYRRARKKEKKTILDEFIQTTDYNRKYASYLLSNWGRKIIIRKGGQTLIMILGGMKKKLARKKNKIYDKEILGLVKKFWAESGFLCGKLLLPHIKEIFDLAEKEIVITKEQKKMLLKISPATIDRLLVKEKKELLRKARSGTKPTTLLVNQIPIKTFSEWDRTKPGYESIDLVGHEGGDPKGEFIQTLDVTDICTQWTETQAVLNKAQIWVLEALKEIRGRIPFEMMGIHSDGGSEFINKPTFEYCQQENLDFTHSRSHKKNDNCFVEQKNYSVVRKIVGYLRYEGEDELKVLNEIYKKLRLITNFFIPSMKLISKKRRGSKVIKIYDTPKTPYRRVLESDHISDEVKEKLKKQRSTLKPFQLRREMLFLQNKLFNMAVKRKKMKENLGSTNYKPGINNTNNFVYNFK